MNLNERYEHNRDNFEQNWSFKKVENRADKVMMSSLIISRKRYTVTSKTSIFENQQLYQMKLENELQLLSYESDRYKYSSHWAVLQMQCDWGGTKRED